MADWKEAAERYRQTQPEAVAERKADRAERMAEALESFLSSQSGVTALELLRASKQYVRFAVSPSEGGYVEVWILDGDGLRHVSEGSGMWVAYSKDGAGQSKLSKTSAKAVANAVLNYGQQVQFEIVDWLKSKLDEIAAAAPRMTVASEEGK